MISSASSRIALFLTLAFLLTAGCSTIPVQHNAASSEIVPVPQTTEKPGPYYRVTIDQAESNHPDYLKMDSDIYKQGEVIEFFVTNLGSESLSCWHDYPSFSLYRQVGTWESLTKREGYQTDYGYYLQRGESTAVERLNTSDLTPGHYKIVTDCGISREFEIHVAPVTTANSL